MLESIFCGCPYCGESIELLIDCSVSEQCYIEDCSVCCSPINVSVCVGDDGMPQVFVGTDRD
ncbi:CPXCG motif-containing cysteine-rich protein [Alcanivorax sp. 1008]|uniref:CPXCG motif-containing cysteine-rich protein n=1 Tax=Alcanivorax sp. 1008 TaxID=2816853 RepID=UPI001E06B837|nr:CPXCG motif-containing cysteine-rich protein [Alcanivorax sp. 1008]